MFGNVDRVTEFSLVNSMRPVELDLEHPEPMNKFHSFKQVRSINLAQSAFSMTNAHNFDGFSNPTKGSDTEHNPF